MVVLIKEISVNGIVTIGSLDLIKTNCIEAFPFLGKSLKSAILLLINNAIDLTSLNKKLGRLSGMVLFGWPQVTCLFLSPIIE